MNDKEKRFFSVLREVFIGARVEGQSGFVNLMRMKSRYYEQGIFPRLSKDIDEALIPFPEFREELFDRLHTFFKRYFSESGSIYFRFTPPHEHVYEKVYTDDWDVTLFWKTHMLYYVKTDRLFQSMRVELDEFRFFFDVSALEDKQANEKRSLVYDFKEQREDGTLVFTVTYSERGKKTDFNNIRKSIKNALGLKRYTAEVPSEEVLERAFRLFERQSEVDYFINKNARRFLREQFNLWLYQYVFEPEERQGTTWTERRIRQLQVLKEIAYKIIDFIAQFEDELVRVWNKPKFVLESHYVITPDRIAAQEGGMEVLERLFAHEGMEAQVKEWRALGMVGEDFTPEQVWVEDLMGRRLHERYRYLPLDTKHFPDMETAILSLFDHLDRELDGWLVHSENYQALKTLLPKFRERVKMIYIDPPYNTGGDEFLYRDDYRHSSWLSMMYNRLDLSKEWMREDGVIFVSVDDNEMERLGLVLEQQFSSDNVLNTVPVIMNLKGNQDEFGFAGTHEYVKIALKNKPMALLGQFPISDEEMEKWEEDEYGYYKIGANLKATGANAPRKKRPNLFFPIYITPDNKISLERTSDEDIELLPITDGQEMSWRWSQKKINDERQNLIVIRDGDTINIYKKQRPSIGDLPTSKPKSVLYKPEYSSGNGTAQVKLLFGQKTYSNPKPIRLIEDYLRIGADRDCFVLDFFAGSGTTAHAAINLNRGDGGRRKYILVEMADYFHTVLLPRIKKVIFSAKWKDGKAQKGGQGISHFVKYFRLEQYEEVLRKARYQDDDAPLFVQGDPYTQYVFLRDTKMLDNAETGERVMEIDRERNAIRVDLSRLYSEIDLAETLSCLTGKWIRRIRPAPDDPARPGTVEFEDGTTVDLQDPPWEMVKPLIWW